MCWVAAVLIWRKPSHTRLLWNVNAICPKTRESGVIMYLLQSAKAICSSVILYNDEAENLRNMLLCFEYPKDLF